MFKRQTLLYATAFCFSIAGMMSQAHANPPQNLEVSKQQLVRYHDSGEYQRDVKKVSTQAISYLKKRINDNAHSAQPKKLAIVFDIDETLLSNYHHMTEHGFGGSIPEIMGYLAEANDPAIASMKKLYQLALDNRVNIFLVTGRDEHLRVATVKNLRQAGIRHWTQLILRSLSDKKRTTIEYKSHARHAIAKQGYDIALNIGDQLSDLRGGYADKTFKLPNPFYFLP